MFDPIESQLDPLQTKRMKGVLRSDGRYETSRDDDMVIESRPDSTYHFEFARGEVWVEMKRRYPFRGSGGASMSETVG